MKSQDFLLQHDLDDIAGVRETYLQSRTEWLEFRQTTAQSMIITGPLLAGAQQLMTTYYHGHRIVSLR